MFEIKEFDPKRPAAPDEVHASREMIEAGIAAHGGRDNWKKAMKVFKIYVAMIDANTEPKPPPVDHFLTDGTRWQTVRKRRAT